MGGSQNYSAVHSVCFSSDRELPRCLCKDVCCTWAHTLSFSLFCPSLFRVGELFSLRFPRSLALFSVSRRRTMISPPRCLRLSSSSRVSSSPSGNYGQRRTRLGRNKRGCEVRQRHSPLLLLLLLLFRTLFFQFSRLGRTNKPTDADADTECPRQVDVGA